MSTDADAALPQDRRLRYGVDCGHTWAWARGEACPECGLLGALAAAEQARDQYQALWCGAARMVREERERATRLEALATAARAWSEINAQPAGAVFRADEWEARREASQAIHRAVANLAIPPEETGAADAP